jgi:hypothetical protein
MNQYRTIFSHKSFDEILNYLENLKLTKVKDSEGNLQVSVKNVLNRVMTFLR